MQERQRHEQPCCSPLLRVAYSSTLYCRTLFTRRWSIQAAQYAGRMHTATMRKAVSAPVLMVTSERHAAEIAVKSVCRILLQTASVACCIACND
eukprot:16184-Heterococcus_DN1.PRE.3